MGEIHGSLTRIYANGYDLSTLFRETEAGRERDLVDATGYAVTDTRHIASPQASGMISAGGMLDVDESTGAAAAHDTLRTAAENTAGDTVVVWMGRDTTAGDPGFAILGSIPQHKIQQPLSDIVKTMLEAKSNRSAWVNSLHPKAARTTAHTTTGIDNGAATTYGGLAIAQVFALTGTTPVLGLKVQHSSDSTNGTDGTWVDLVSFTAINAAGVTAGYRSTGRVTGTVNRWLRVVLSVTSGSLSSCTFAVQFGRYPTSRR